MTLDQMKYALAVLKTGQFSKAAESCHISQPSLSVQVALLEKELGTNLFVRTRKGTLVTEQGLVLLQKMQEVLDQVEGIYILNQEIKGQVQGRFRLGIISTLAPSLLPLFVDSFMKLYPKIELDIIEDRTENLVKAIDQGGIDAAILSTPQKTPGHLIEMVLFYEPFFLFASNQHSLLDSKTVSVQNLSSQEIILLDETHCLRDQVLKLCQLKKESSDRRLQFQSSSMQTVIELIRNQSGYTLLPGLSLGLLSKNEIQKNVRSFSKPLPARKISLVYHPSRGKKTTLAALKEEIKKSVLNKETITLDRSLVRVLSPNDEHFEI